MRVLRILCLAACPFLAIASAAEDASSLKPASNDPAAAVKCKRLSDAALRRDVRTLIIGFEGLASYSKDGTRAAYAYHAALAQKRAAAAPKTGGGGYVVYGLMLPTIAQYPDRFEFLMFAYTDVASASACALAWMQVPERRLLVAGHSYGGDAAVQLAEALEKRSITIDHMLTIDPRAVFPRPGSVIHKTANVLRWENFYQLDQFIVAGRPIEDAHVNRRLFAGHTSMPSQPDVRASLNSALSR